MDLQKYQLLFSMYTNSDNIALLLDDNFNIVWSNNSKVPIKSNLIAYLPLKCRDDFTVKTQKVTTIEISNIKYAAKIRPVSCGEEFVYFAELYSPGQAINLAVNSGAYSVIQSILADITTEVNRLFDIENYNNQNIEIEKEIVVQLYKTRSAVLNTLLVTLMNTTEFFENKKGEYYTCNIDLGYTIQNICSECNKLSNSYLKMKNDKIVYPESISDFIIHSNMRKLTIVLLNIIGVLICNCNENDVINVNIAKTDTTVSVCFISKYNKDDLDSIRDEINIHLAEEFIVNSGGELFTGLDNSIITIDITFPLSSDDLTLESDKSDLYDSNSYAGSQNSLINIFYKGFMNLS